jgi:hypothetical protein
MQNKWRLLREAAYAQGLDEWRELSEVPTFREFVALYIAEVYERCRNVVSIANSDTALLGPISRGSGS